MKNELIKWFPAEDFSWIYNNFPEEKDEDENGQDKEIPTENNPSDLASNENVIVIDENVIEDQDEATEDVPPTL